MDFLIMNFSRSSFIQVFGGVAAPHMWNHPKTWWNLEPSWPFPRWNSVIMNQIGKHNGKLKRKLYHFSNSSQKHQSKNSPLHFCRQKNCLLLRSSWDFPNFLAEICGRFSGWCCFHQGRSVTAWLGIAFRALGTFGGNAQRSGVEGGWKGDGPGWERMPHSPRFPTDMGFTGLKRGQRCTEFLETQCICFREPMFWVGEGIDLQYKTPGSVRSDSQKLCKVHLFEIGWSRDVLKLGVFYSCTKKCSSWSRGLQPQL